MTNNPKEVFEKAVDFFAKGQRDEAVLMLLEIIETNPDFYDAYETLGMVFYKQGLLDEAIAWTQKLALICPDHAMAHTNLSVFYMKKGDKIKAEEEKAKATVLNFGKMGKKS